MQEAIVIPTSVVPVTRAVATDTYRYFRSSPDFPSHASPIGSPAPSGLDDPYGGDLDAD